MRPAIPTHEPAKMKPAVGKVKPAVWKMTPAVGKMKPPIDALLARQNEHVGSAGADGANGGAVSNIAVASRRTEGSIGASGEAQ